VGADSKPSERHENTTRVAGFPSAVEKPVSIELRSTGSP
jgi:hypothetical protein